MTDRHCHVVGLGLIGASLALAFTHAGWSVTGEDVDGDVTSQALAEGIVQGSTPDPSTSLVVVATPAGAVSDVVAHLATTITNPDTLFTDVAGVKREIVATCVDPRFIGGHPMAGSELRGIAGARADLFTGCTWVLTPTEGTSPERYSQLHGYIRELGASVLAVSAEDHDRLVALASHVPHVLAVTLMNQAAEAAKSDGALLQLAAGGFRDMTRIAAGDPFIWPDILVQNRTAILHSLDEVQLRIGQLREAIEREDRPQLSALLTEASASRRQLPGRSLQSDALAHLRVPMSDRPGVLSLITRVAADLQVNIFDIEIAHGIEGAAGTLLLAVDRSAVNNFAAALEHEGFTVGVEQ